MNVLFAEARLSSFTPSENVSSSDVVLDRPFYYCGNDKPIVVLDHDVPAVVAFLEIK